MMEANAFLAMFTVQILAMSVLLPGWLTRQVRESAARLPVERLARAYPGIDHARILDRYLTRFRFWTLGIALLGLLPLIWFFNYTQRPDWDDGPVEALVGAYFLVQALPLWVAAWLVLKIKKKVLASSSPEPRRKAVLQRRRLFHFVSPLVVLVAALAYLLFAAFAIYLDQHPFPGYAGAVVNIGAITVLYASQSLAAYWMLYGKKINRLETDADSVRKIGVAVRLCVCLCIAGVVGISISFMLVLLDEQRWEPFAQSGFLVFIAILCSLAIGSKPQAKPAGISSLHERD